MAAMMLGCPVWLAAMVLMISKHSQYRGRCLFSAAAQQQQQVQFHVECTNVGVRQKLHLVYARAASNNCLAATAASAGDFSVKSRCPAHIPQLRHLHLCDTTQDLARTSETEKCRLLAL